MDFDLCMTAWTGLSDATWTLLAATEIAMLFFVSERDLEHASDEICNSALRGSTTSN